MAKQILIIPDSHWPDTDMKVFRGMLRFIQEIEPDEIVHIGDLMDYPQPSRWTKGTREEFEGNIFEDSEEAVKKFLTPLRDVFDGPIGVHEGNHDLRARAYGEKYAPALWPNEFFHMENLLHFEDMGITMLPDFYSIAPGWLSTHGHLGGIRLNQNAGNTALNAAKRIGKNIIMGHTHRAGITSYTTGLAGETNTLTGVEVGHIMDTKKVTYLKGATGNWQKAFGMLTVEGQTVVPDLIPICAGRIVWKDVTIKL